jgi:hypothetical protein
MQLAPPVTTDRYQRHVRGFFQLESLPGEPQQVVHDLTAAMHKVGRVRARVESGFEILICAL